MPLTLVHPAAVLPLARGPLNLLALVAGSLAPDLPYYLRALPLPVSAESWYEPYVNATTSHSLAGLFPVALPLALAVFVVGSLLLPPLRWVVDADPRSAAATPGLRQGLQRGAWVVVSLVIGVLTHLAWDALTEGGSGSRLVQHGSTVVGLVILAVVAWRRRGLLDWRDAAVRRRLLAAGIPCGLATVGGAVIGGWSWLRPVDGASTGKVVEGVVTDAAKGAGVGLIAAAAVLALAWWARRLLGSTRAPRSSTGTH